MSTTSSVDVHAMQVVKSDRAQVVTADDVQVTRDPIHNSVLRRQTTLTIAEVA